MIREPNVLLNDLIFSLSSALDLARPELVDHQQRVAYIALSISQALGWSEEEQAVVLYAGCLHDIGLLTVADKMRARICEDTANDGHPEVGWNVLLKFRLFRQAAYMGSRESPILRNPRGESWRLMGLSSW